MDALKRYGFFALAAVLAVGGLAVGDGYDVMAWMAAALAVCAGVIQISPTKGVFATSLVCFGANAYLFSRKLDASGSSMCNINELINCDVVNQSAASEMFGIPITLFGMGFYLGLVFASLYSEKNAPRFLQVNTLFAIPTLLYSAYLGWEAKQIGAVCVMCISIYIGNVLLLWAGVRGLRERRMKLLDGLGDLPLSTALLTIAGTFAVVVLVGSSTLAADADPVQKLAETTDPNSAEFLSTLFSTPRGTIRLDGSEPVLGDPDAPYTIVEWADYGCPHCARASAELKVLIQEDPSIQLRFKTFPLTAACNPGLERDTGPERCKAAMAAECAGEQGRFWEVQHLLFVNQGRFDDGDLAYMAKQAEVDMDAWETCMTGQDVVDGVVADARAGIEAGVMGTPAMYLKGTHGDAFVEVIGTGAVQRLIDAHRKGINLPLPGPPREN